jgi:hypothetical protein
MVLWTSHAYVGHQADEVTFAAWTAHALVLGCLWGLVPIVLAALSTFANGGSGFTTWLGLLGGVQACGWYFLGLWIFTFRYPPHWLLYGMQVLGAAGGTLALWAAIALRGHRSLRAAQR